MKKISIVFFIGTLLMMSWACTKSSDTPSVSFVVTTLDSAKISTLDSVTISGIIKNHTDGYFVNVQPNTPTIIYDSTLYFKYTGSGSDFRVIYAGDSTHIYNPQNDSTLSTGDAFTDPFYSHRYSNISSGNVTVTAVATSIKNNGKNIYVGKLSETFIITLRKIHYH